VVQIERSPTPAADGKSYYVVRSGDTLTHIAVRFNTSVARLKLLNGWKGNVIIYTGQRIIVGP
jgi:LysM repeat protein